ncbi:MAG TPA: phage minor head protein [Candidatus Dormibacteraeota bacterium]|nr:phage minor head protein [Candidatus Dormibacteraeota bacterium]
MSFVQQPVPLRTIRPAAQLGSAHAHADAAVPTVARAFHAAVRVSRPDPGPLAMALHARHPALAEERCRAALADFAAALHAHLLPPLLSVAEVSIRQTLGRVGIAKAISPKLPPDAEVPARIVAGRVAGHPVPGLRIVPPMLPRTLGVPMDFRLVNAEAVRVAASQIGDRITAIGPDTLAGVRAYIAQAIRVGIPPARAARTLGQMVGLTVRDAGRVVRYDQGLMEAGSDPQVADRLGQRMTDRLLRQRGMLIARTETIRASALGQQAAWQASASAGYLDPKTQGQEWIASGDACPICLALDGEVVPLGSAFSDGSTGPPDPHPACRCALGWAELPTT